MDQYVALDVSLKETSVCVLDANGVVAFEGRIPSEPASLVQLIRSIGLETGRPRSGSGTLSRRLAGRVHGRQTCSCRPFGSTGQVRRSDARGLAEMVRMGWYREVQIKSLAAHERRALLAARHRLVLIRLELDAQIRGMLKPFGLIVGPGNSDAFIRRAEELAQAHPVLAPLLACLAEVRRHVTTQIGKLDREIGRIVRTDTTLRRFMTVPGVGPVTALAFLSTIDDPSRFRRARDVGPYLGLTPKRYQSGETDRQGRISKCGDDLHPHVPLRGSERASHGATLVASEGLGCSPCKADRSAKGPSRYRAQACGHPALHLDGRNPVLVDKGDGIA